MTPRYLVMLQSYRSRIAKYIRPARWLLGVVLLTSVDVYRRYSTIVDEIAGSSVLDVGAGGMSLLQAWGRNCVSLDLRKAPGLDVLASATHLPFRSDSFDSVVSADTIEHIPPNRRNEMIAEMKRVAKERVVIHSPVENGVTFASRRYDIAFGEWHKRVRGYGDKNVEEHIANVEPSPPELETQGFILRGTHNADVWLSYMRITYSLAWPLGLVAGHLYYLFTKSNDKKPPFWGAVGVYRKVHQKQSVSSSSEVGSNRTVHIVCS